MSWFKRDGAVVKEQDLWNAFSKLQARIEGLQAQIDRVELAHKSLRGKIYKEKALDEQEQEEEKAEGINMHSGRFV